MLISIKVVQCYMLTIKETEFIAKQEIGYVLFKIGKPAVKIFRKINLTSFKDYVNKNIR